MTRPDLCFLFLKGHSGRCMEIGLRIGKRNERNVRGPLQCSGQGMDGDLLKGGGMGGGSHCSQHLLSDTLPHYCI